MDADTMTQQADDAFEAIRALNHATITGGPIPAPLAYLLLGNLHQLGFGLDQLVRQLAAGLVRSLDAFDVYDDNRDPSASVAMATDALLLAGKHAARLGECLAAAQLAINLQGYRLPVDGSED